MANKIGEYFILGAYATLLYIMVRPRSQGPALVNNVFGGLAKLTNAETGGGGF